MPTNFFGRQTCNHYEISIACVDPQIGTPMSWRLNASKREEIAANIDQEVSFHYDFANNAGCSTVIWSSEGISLLRRRKELRKLHALFKRHSQEIEIIMCSRNAKSFRGSWIAQLRKMGYQKSSNPDSFCYTNADSWLFNRGPQIHMFASVFDKVTIFGYKRCDNVKYFLMAAGLPADIAPTSQYRENISFQNIPDLLPK